MSDTRELESARDGEGLEERRRETLLETTRIILGDPNKLIATTSSGHKIGFAGVDNSNPLSTSTNSTSESLVRFTRLKDGASITEVELTLVIARARNQSRSGDKGDEEDGDTNHGDR